MKKVMGVILILLLGMLLYKIYMPRVNAFGCFDDCNNFMGGYFLLHGKKLFSEIFFNHNPGMAYISAFIQAMTHPQNLYELVLRHRQFVLGFAVCMDVLLFLRFGWIALPFVLLFEFSKFYLFGDRFLAEGIVVYPILYLTGLGWDRLGRKNLALFDYILAAVFTWLVVFTREPYVPLALFLFGFILWNKKFGKQHIVSLVLFVGLSIATVIYHNIPEFIFNVYTTNVGTTFAGENQTTGIFGIGIWKAFLYPLLLLFGGTWGYFRFVEVGVDILFLLGVGFLLVCRQWRKALFLVFLLGLANLRYVTPGDAFFGAFHLLIWYGLLIFITSLLIEELWRKNGRMGIILFGGVLIVFASLFVSKDSFIRQRANPQVEFITNYGDVMGVGNVIKDLSTPHDTLFLDGSDDIIYWVADRYSNYKYSWYTSLMPYFPKYTKARLTMFKNNPPDFYYGTCPGQKDPNYLMPLSLQDKYTRLLKNNKPSCLWVKDSKISSVTSSQWQAASQYFYTLPAQVR